MPITPTNPFKGRQFPGEVIILCVRWYLRYPLAYQHVAELLAERGVEVDPSCIWRWVQTYAPELNKRCRPHLKPANKSYRIDETYIKVKGEDKYLISRRRARTVTRRSQSAPRLPTRSPRAGSRWPVRSSRPHCLRAEPSRRRRRSVSRASWRPSRR